MAADSRSLVVRENHFFVESVILDAAAAMSLAMLEGVNALSFASIRSPFSASARVTR